MMTAVLARDPATLRLMADPRRPAFKVASALQMLAALVLMAFTWPFLVSLARAVPPIVAGDLNSPAARAASAWFDPNSLWLALNGWLATAIVEPTSSPLTVFQPIGAGFVLVAAGVFWLLGNALRPCPRPTPKLTRNP